MTVPFPDLRDRDLCVAIVGATGAVGEVLLGVLEERGFPVGELRPLASGRSAGTKIQFKGASVEVAEATPDCVEPLVEAAYPLWVSCTSDRADATLLQGATVPCTPLFAFADNDTDVARMAFWVDRDPAFVPNQVERKHPYDVAGGNQTHGNPLALSLGEHLITTRVHFDDGSTAMTCARFDIAPPATCTTRSI